MTGAPSLAGYAVLGDGNTAALVDRHGAIEWWCVPRFDSSSVFGRLLDRHAGHWEIRPADGEEVVSTSRRYVPGTLVLATELRTASGAFELTDALALGRSEPHAIGRELSPRLVRRVRGIAGDVDLELDLAPRFDYGRDPAHVRSRGDTFELSDAGGATRLRFVGDRRVEAHRGVLRGRFRLRAGEQATFALGVGDAEVPDAEIDDTVRTWRGWSASHDRYHGRYADEVRRSSLILQALTYQPTGAVVAAATTSLPEEIGGSANWDYRYAWLRDASIVLQALWVGACPDEAGRYFAWMSRAISGADGAGRGADEARLQIVYGLDGEQELPERELPHLEGYRNSRPVRVGNDAWTQRQLDVPGEVLDAAWTLRDQLGDSPDGELLRRLADEAAVGWTKPDAGIWEGREGERHFTSSKLMCWVALDRAVRLVDRLGLGAGDAVRWSAERERVRASILADGWSDAANAFTGAFGSDHLDASVLLMPLVGFLPADDPRIEATVEAIETQLSDGGLVRRWTGGEGEGAFVICSYWLAECHALAGRHDRAAEIFEHVTGHASDLGVLSEMLDPGSGDMVGNLPQALSHAGLIRAAWTLDQAGSHREDHEQ